MNLAVNAQDAMPMGGLLTIELDELEVRPQEPSSALLMTVRAGRYVRLRVSDTGEGMPLETQENAFEPFFTTKEQGKGTGLGLATVHGIVTQSNGHIWIESAPGSGARFTVLFPAVTHRAEAAAGPVILQTEPGRSGTILVVEDQPALRRFLQRTLERAGYAVLEAANGEEGLQVAAGHDAPLALVATDVVML